MPEFENAYDFERVIGLLFRQSGWQVDFPAQNNRGYDLAVFKDQYKAAVQVKNHKAKVRVPQLERFVNYLDLPIAQKFNSGFFISASGFSHQSLTYFSQLNRPGFYLGTYQNGTIKWIDNLDPDPPERKQVTYIGVFTCKGGVGKTTVAAHLAGAFALTGYDVALIDLDPQRNLSTLLGEGIFLPSKSRKRAGNTISIYNYDDWDEYIARDNQIVICDCSPMFETGQIELMKKFHYCIIPTTLNPLGLNKNGHVILSTLNEIRGVNKDAHLFVLINNYLEDDNQKTRILKEQYQRYFAELSQRDPNFQFIDPDEVAIRFSKQLFYWGFHIYTGSKSELAFNSIGGRGLPKTDFLNLIEFLEAHTTILEQKA